jgi:tetratricopeptide (TPR) repeat protein
MISTLLLLSMLGPAGAQSTSDWGAGGLAGPKAAPAKRPAAAGAGGRSELPPGAEEAFRAARRASEKKNWAKAAEEYGAVLRDHPKHVNSVLGLGHVLEESGNRDAAIAAYGRLPKHPGAMEAKGFLLEKTSPRRAAALYRELQQLRPDDADPHIFEARALLRVKGAFGNDPDSPTGPVMAAESIDRYLQLVQSEPDTNVILDAVGALVSLNEGGKAEVLLERFLQKWEHVEDGPAFKRRLREIEVERLASGYGVGGAEPLTEELLKQVEEARELAAEGDLGGALLDLQAVVQDAPKSAEAWAALGDIRELLGQVREAETAFAWATALEPEEATWHVRLGLLLEGAYGGKRDPDARDQLRTAVSLRPNQADLRFHLGRLHHSLREYDRALEHYQAYIEAEPGGDLAGVAAEAVEALSRRAPPPIGPVSGGARPSDVPDEALTHYNTARVYRDQGNLKQARDELSKALEAAPEWVAAVNLEAAIELSEGDTEGAISVWERSLKMDPTQARIRLSIGEIQRSRGDLGLARDTLARAAADGAADAFYLLAEMAYTEHSYLEAEELLASFFSRSTGGLRRDPAQALQQRVKTRLLQIKAAIGGSLALAIALVAGFVLRRRTSASLDALIQAAPEASHDVARVVSSIRHELLKHNTSLLDEMAEALDKGEDHAVSWGANRLFGGPDQPGISARFRTYRRELERLGRRHGVRLDLRRTDPVFAPIHEALSALAGLEKVLRSPPKRQGARERAADALRGISLVLNDESYKSLGDLLLSLGSLEINQSRIEAIDARVRAEPGVDTQSLGPLELVLPSGPVYARVFAGDLNDITANLLRNAYGAIGDGGRVGLAVVEVVDPITGIAAIELRFRDTADGAISDSILHGRGIGRGLGLTRELVSRHEGTIHVEPEPGWSKAIVVSLAMVDQAVEAVVELEEGS